MFGCDPCLGHTVVGQRLEPWSTQCRNMDLTLALDDTVLVAESPALEGLGEASLGMWLGSRKAYSECPTWVAGEQGPIQLSQTSWPGL